MIFRNTFRLLFSNFSNVWKLLLYYVLCLSLTALVCGWFVVPIVGKLIDANVFATLSEFFSQIFSRPLPESAKMIEEIGSQTLNVLASNVQFRFNYIFITIWLLFVFPVSINLANLAVGEVLYGYMTSQVRYSFTGRFVKNLGKSTTYSITNYFVLLVFNAINVALFWGALHFMLNGGAKVLLSLLMFALFLVCCALKRTIFACWMPAIAVLDLNPLKALVQNFKTTFRNFFSIFSNMLLLFVTAIVFNLIFGVFTAGVSLLITLPLCAFVFQIAQMVSFFYSHGMRFYVYPDMFISPKRFEEQDSITKIKNLI